MKKQKKKTTVGNEKRGGTSGFAQQKRRKDNASSIIRPRYARSDWKIKEIMPSHLVKRSLLKEQRRVHELLQVKGESDVVRKVGKVVALKARIKAAMISLR